MGFLSGFLSGWVSFGALQGFCRNLSGFTEFYGVLGFFVQLLVSIGFKTRVSIKFRVCRGWREGGGGVWSSGSFVMIWGLVGL